MAHPAEKFQDQLLLLADDINGDLSRLDRHSAEGDALRIVVGHKLNSLFANVPKGTWEQFCQDHIDRSLSDIRELRRIANAADPAAAHEAEKAKQVAKRIKAKATVATVGGQVIDFPQKSGGNRQKSTPAPAPAARATAEQLGVVQRDGETTDAFRARFYRERKRTEIRTFSRSDLDALMLSYMDVMQIKIPKKMPGMWTAFLTNPIHRKRLLSFQTFVAGWQLAPNT